MTLFQCPSAGFSHFYMIFSVNVELYENVSMPFRGLFSFLLEKREYYDFRKICFNALPRAFLISTYPLKKPLFFKDFRAIFADICQNILAKTLFRGVYDLFIIRSYFLPSLIINYTPFIYICHLHFMNFFAISLHSLDVQERQEICQQ